MFTHESEYILNLCPLRGRFALRMQKRSTSLYSLSRLQQLIIINQERMVADYQNLITFTIHRQLNLMLA